MRVLVTGARGELGSAVVAALSRSHDVQAYGREHLDIRDHRAVRDAVASANPGAVINAAAFTDVDRAEDRPVDALDVNAFAVCSLAEAAAARGALFIHYSTDFVFDGEAARPYAETDPPNPRGTYACSKLLGEWFAAENPRHYVLRVESLFGTLVPDRSGRRTSVDRIVDAIAEGRAARVFVDRTVSPSYVRDVTAVTRFLLERQPPPGLYHCVNSGSCKWLELGLEVARQLRVEPRLESVNMVDLSLRAPRPRYCALSNEKLRKAGFDMPAWQDALADYLGRRRSAS